MNVSLDIQKSYRTALCCAGLVRAFEASPAPIHWTTLMTVTLTTSPIKAPTDFQNAPLNAAFIVNYFTAVNSGVIWAVDTAQVVSSQSPFFETGTWAMRPFAELMCFQLGYWMRFHTLPARQLFRTYAPYPSTLRLGCKQPEGHCPHHCYYHIPQGSWWKKIENHCDHFSF